MSDNFYADVTLRDILANAEAFPWDATLYPGARGRWGLDSPSCIIRDDQTLYCDAAHPRAVARGLTNAIGEVVSNASHQLGSPTDLQLLDALADYCEHDAFRTFV